MKWLKKQLTFVNIAIVIFLFLNFVALYLIKSEYSKDRKEVLELQKRLNAVEVVLWNAYSDD